MKQLLFTFIILIIITGPILSQDEQSKNENNLSTSAFRDIAITGQWFLSYQTGRKSGITDNEFLLKRGYITFQKKFNKNFLARVTQDVSVDREGDGEGDIEIRLKYGYLRYIFDRFGVFNKLSLDFGLVHRPWIDFEQGINLYRVQGTMFMERYGILSSADYGISLSGLLGDEMSDEFKERISKNAPGKYGSFSIGLYNGGGYHAIEKNENKLIDGRITLRPFYGFLPGLQVSLIGAIGKGNIESSPEFNQTAGFLSFESKNYIFTGTYYLGKGFENGSKLNSDGSAVKNSGFSLFANLAIQGTKLSIFGRYDFFKSAFYSADVTNKRIITGLSYSFLEGSKVVIDFDKVSRSNSSKPDDYFLELAVEVRY